MWPKLLDLTQDECRGALRRLELESYSNVVGTFRAQGTLTAVKLRILKDLREAFHISDVRHKAEVRRVVNDESLSTIAKMIYGPNSEIEWNKEGSRGFLIINRKPSQTALSSVADQASEIGETLNKNLKHPCDTSRERRLSSNRDVDATEKIITNDPACNHAEDKMKTEPPPPPPPPLLKAVTNVNVVNTEANRIESSGSITKKKDTIKTSGHTEIPLKTALKTPTVDSSDNNKPRFLPKIENTPIPIAKQITPNSRRRKSTTSLANHSAPPKAILLSNRRDTMIETSLKVRDHLPTETHFQPAKTKSNEIQIIPKEIPEKREEMPTSAQIYSSNTIHRTLSSNDASVQVIEAVVPQKMETIKGTRNVMNAISQGAQLVKVIDSKIIKKPVNITTSNAYVTKIGPLKSVPMKQTFTSNKAPNVDYLTANDSVRISKFAPIKTHKIQVISSDASSLLNSGTVVQRTLNHKNDIIPIPTARNPNIVKTSDKTIMHVSPNLSLKNQIKKPVSNNAQNYAKYQPKHVVKIMQPQPQSRTVTIHPNSKILKVPAQVSTINQVPQEYFYEDSVNHWQNYDPTRIDNQNGYANVGNTPNNGLEYQNHAPNIISENIIYDEDIITEEYITTEDFVTDNVIEMEVDMNYGNDDMVLVSSNVINS